MVTGPRTVTLAHAFAGHRRQSALMTSAQVRAEQHEQAARAAPPEQAAIEWGRAAMEWLTTPEFARAGACWAHQAEAYEALAGAAEGEGSRAAHYRAAADAWGLVDDPAREAAALVRGGLVTAALEVWRRVGDPAPLAREAEQWAAAFERTNELLLAGEVWAIAGRPERATEVRRRLFGPYLPFGWDFEMEEQRDARTGELVRAVARLFESNYEWHRLEVERLGDAADRVAVQDLLARVVAVVAAVERVHAWVQRLGGWALVSNERLPIGELDARWRLGARHVRSNRLVEVSDADPLVVCDKLVRPVQRAHDEIAAAAEREATR